MSQQMKRGIVGVVAWAAIMLSAVGVLVHWTVTAAAQSAPAAMMLLDAAPAASAPASQPEGLIGVVSIVEKAWGAHNWPAIFVAVCMGLLWFERNFKGRTGWAFSRWMGTPLGIILSSLLTSVVSAISSVAFNGWAAIGHAALLAAVMGLVNAAIQYTGPAAGPTTPVPAPADPGPLTPPGAR